MRRLLLTLLVPAAVIVAQQPDFAGRGPYADTFRVEDIPGTTETMENSRIYFPDSAGTFPGRAVPAPIVVFGHGWQMGIDRYYSYARHLASWGYVVVLPTISNPLIVPDHYARARLMIDAARFTAGLDTVPGDRFYRRLDPWNWGFAGHSMGGGLAMLAADTFGLQETLRVVVAIHSPQTTPPTHPAHILQPRLVLAGSMDNIAPWNDVRTAFWQGGNPPGTFAVITGANHGHVMDYSYFWENGGTATITRAEQQRIIRRHLTAFLERYLHGDSSDWNYNFTYGDSVLHSPVFDSVEVLLPPVSCEESVSGLFESRITLSPAPVRDRVFIRYAVCQPGPVLFSVHDAQGRLVSRLVSRSEPSGIRTVVWQPQTSLPSGSYFLRLALPETTAIRSLLLIR